MRAWIAGTMPNSPMATKSEARKAQYLADERDGESSVMMVNIPIAVIPAR